MAWWRIQAMGMESSSSFPMLNPVFESRNSNREAIQERTSL
jgi:hypothetical protein